MKYKSATKDAIEELKYSIEPNQGFMECRTGTISEETIRMAIEALENKSQKSPIMKAMDMLMANLYMILGYALAVVDITKSITTIMYIAPNADS